MANPIRASRSEDGPNARESRTNSGFQSPWFGNIPAGFIVAAVILYVAGWSYIYGYFSAFGLSLLDIGFDVHQTMMLAGQGLPLWFYGALIAVLALYISLEVIALWKTPHGRAAREHRGQHAGKPSSASFFGSNFLGSMTSLCVAMLLLAILSHDSIQRGRNDADHQMREGTNLPMARLMLDKSKFTGQLLGNLANINPDNSLEGFLLVHGRTGYYVFRRVAPHPKISGISRTNVTVSFVPDQVVLAAEITTPILEGK